MYLNSGLILEALYLSSVRIGAKDTSSYTDLSG